MEVHFNMKRLLVFFMMVMISSVCFAATPKGLAGFKLGKTFHPSTGWHKYLDANGYISENTCNFVPFLTYDKCIVLLNKKKKVIGIELVGSCMMNHLSLYDPTFLRTAEILLDTYGAPDVINNNETSTSIEYEFIWDNVVVLLSTSYTIQGYRQVKLSMFNMKAFKRQSFIPALY